ncbi:MAG: hypothetical protein AB8F95_19395 [Bacteroidia bacterium]
MQISFGFSPAYIILIVGIAALLSWLMYRGTRDLLPALPRWALAIFRFLVLATIGILLLEPMLNSQKRNSEIPIIAVLQDDSESLVAHKDSTFVRNEYPGLLNNFLTQFSGEKYQTDFYTFSSKLENGASADSLGFNASGTNLSNALESLQKRYQNQNLGAIVLATDGIPTSGKNPLYSIDRFRQPVYTVLLGDTTVQRDVKVTEVLYNELAYLKSEIPIRVTVRSEGYEKSSLKVSLRGDGKVLKTEPITLGRNRVQGDVNFLIKPTTAGVRQYTISVSRMDQEVTYRNNSKRIFINVLETRAKIAIFAGSSHPDLGALNEAFKREDRYEVTSFIRKTNTSFYTNPTAYNLADFDLFILHNFPISNADRDWATKLAEEAEKRKKPIFFFIGSRTNLAALQPLYPYMAATPASVNPRSEEVIANFTPKYKDHSTYTFPDAWLQWANSAPPLYRNRSGWQPKPTANVFATASIKNVKLNYPVYVLQNQLGRKSAVFIGENFWRMRAHSYIESEGFELFDDWFFNNLKWLTVTDDKRRFKVNPGKRLYTGGEAIRFKGQAYDDSYNPVPGGEIKIQLTDPKGNTTDYFMNESGQGQYFLELNKLTEGTYRYSADGRKEGKPLGKDAGQFSVGESNIEHFRLRADQSMMRQLALRTGGEFSLARDMASLALNIQDNPNLKPIVSFQKSRKGFNELPWILGLILALLSIEWIVRKLYSLL